MKTPVLPPIKSALLAVLAVSLSSLSSALADFVINDDLIVDGSACVGFDCVNGESFGFDTIRLKENNLRIKFDDTSVAAAFPRNDWQLTANDSANGGAEKFSIDDVGGGRTPFTIEHNAPSHSLYVDDGGRVGMGTSTPSVEIHTVDGDTPTLRLQQDNSSGFAPQTWDVAGNETNFFVRDVTGGSALPFRIRPGAPTSSIFIDVGGDLGIGTASVSDSDGLSDRFVDIKDTESVRLVLDRGDGGGKFGEVLFQENNNNRWSFGQDDMQFYIFNYVTSQNVMTINEATADVTFPGAVTVNGVFTNPSDRNLKENIQEIDKNDILKKVAELPITSWNYKSDQDNTLHIGPMAQDFYDAFELGGSRTGIFVTDVTGVTLATVQALNEKLQALNEKNEEKDAKIMKLEKRLEKLERLLNGPAK